MGNAIGNLNAYGYSLMDEWKLNTTEKRDVDEATSKMARLQEMAASMKAAELAGPTKVLDFLTNVVPADCEYDLQTAKELCEKPEAN